MRFEALNWWEMASHFVYLTIAYVLALPTGWDRERPERTVGLRTFPLVAIASCSFVLVSIGCLEKAHLAMLVFLKG